jgi:hypothetical protein
LFAAINVGSHYVYFGERLTPFFIAKNTLIFTLIVQQVFFFLLLHLAFFFALIFVQILLSLHQGVFRPLVDVGFPQDSCFEKKLMVLEKRKSLMQKVVQKGACLDCGLDFFMSCLMSF